MIKKSCIDTVCLRKLATNKIVTNCEIEIICKHLWLGNISDTTNF